MTRSILDIRFLPPADQLPLIAPGVRGYISIGRELRIPLVQAEIEGSGAVADFLDSLPRDRPIVFECVVSGKLERMLQRRGFHREGNDWIRRADQTRS